MANYLIMPYAKNKDPTLVLRCLTKRGTHLTLLTTFPHCSEEGNIFLCYDKLTKAANAWADKVYHRHNCSASKGPVEKCRKRKLCDTDPSPFGSYKASKSVSDDSR
ncbi:hypothetical protein PoB_007520700 [Plakobranchus ocellatus]|uniref:Uncharacterized protein n=1 Tax=Plakobranchus ocellatus TaxID=259542 RepID=A0AAV4DWM9_9GAST|nr:hypothetical protein PoB_007520700 [Plakobranchus ocellatus]